MAEEEPKICQICADFEPQAWRKSLCRNCFHTLEEHSEEMLAAQAEAISKEIQAKDGSKNDVSGKAKDEKSKTSKQSTLGKRTAPETKENKPSTPMPGSKNAPFSKSPSSSASPSTPKSSLKSSSSSSSSSPTTATKSSSSSSSSSSTSSLSTSSTKTTSSSSPSSSPSSSSKTGKSSLGSSSSSTSTSSSTSQVPPTISKAKSLTSKFENVAKSKENDKDIASSKTTTTPKSLSKSTSDTNNKLSPAGSKETSQRESKSPKPDHSKTNKVDDTKKPFSKSPTSLRDSKKDSDDKDGSVKSTTPSGKDDDTKSKSTTSGIGGAKPIEDKDSKNPSLNSKHKYAAPFGKGMLRSAKDKDKEKETIEKRPDKTSLQKDSGVSEVKSKLGSPGDNKSKFDSLERRGTKTDDQKLLKTPTDKSTERANSPSTSSTSAMSGSVSLSKIGQSEKTGSGTSGTGKRSSTASATTQRVEDKDAATKSGVPPNAQSVSTPGAKHTREINDKPVLGKINNTDSEQSKNDAKKPLWHAGGGKGEGGGGGGGGGKEKEGVASGNAISNAIGNTVEVKNRNEKTKDDNITVGISNNKRIPPSNNALGGGGGGGGGSKDSGVIGTGKIEKDRLTLQNKDRGGVSGRNAKESHDGKQTTSSVDGAINRPGHSTASTSSSSLASKTTTVTTASSSPSVLSGVANKSSSSITATTSSSSSSSSSFNKKTSNEGVAFTTTTTAAAAVAVATTTVSSSTTSASLSKYLPSLQARKGSKDVIETSDVSSKGGKTTATSLISPKDSTDTGATSSSDSSHKEVEKLSKELKLKSDKVASLESQLGTMEKKLKSVEEEKKKAVAMAASTKNTSTPKSEKDELEKTLQALRSQLSEMQEQCVKMATDNKSLSSKLQEQEKLVKECQDVGGKNEENEILERDLELTEKELDEVKDENSELQREIMEMKNEMDEMYDTFRENEQDEFRELQKELDMTAKNCRILQFKFRKAERRNEQIEEDRMHYEEKLRHLQNQFDSQDAKTHIRVLEEELRIAKEVSVRLHDELDIIEDKKLKALEDNKHLTELLEHTDKRQFRMEMEIDKLRELVCDLRQQLKETRSGSVSVSGHRDSSTPEQTTATSSPTKLERQSSKEGQLQEYDASQLMRDLCDTMERENDLKDQLKFTEEEAKTLRRRVSDMDEENENLRVQLQRMSEKASKHKKREQDKGKELEEERKLSEAAKAILTAHQQGHGQATLADYTLVFGAGSADDIIPVDEPIPVSERKDSTDEDLMNVMQLRIQLEMLEQELMTSHKKMDEMDLENENLMEEVKFLQERLGEYEKNQDSTFRPDPSSSSSEYYLDKIKELNHDNDILRWKMIEKEREMERMSLVQSRHSREQPSHSKKLKKSKSLDNDHDPVVNDLRKQLDHVQMELIKARQRADEAEERSEDLLQAQIDSSQTTQPSIPFTAHIPGIVADDAASENIDLREKVRKMEADIKGKADTIKGLTNDLQKLSRDPGKYHNAATSPMSSGNQGILDIPHPCSGTTPARAKLLATNQNTPSLTRDDDRKLPLTVASSPTTTLQLQHHHHQPSRKGEEGRITEEKRGKEEIEEEGVEGKRKRKTAVMSEEPRGEADGADDGTGRVSSPIHVHFAADPVITLDTEDSSGFSGSSKIVPPGSIISNSADSRTGTDTASSSCEKHGGGEGEVVDNVEDVAFLVNVVLVSEEAGEEEEEEDEGGIKRIEEGVKDGLGILNEEDYVIVQKEEEGEGGEGDSEKLSLGVRETKNKHFGDSNRACVGQSRSISSSSTTKSSGSDGIAPQSTNSLVTITETINKERDYCTHNTGGTLALALPLSFDESKDIVCSRSSDESKPTTTATPNLISTTVTETLSTPLKQKSTTRKASKLQKQLKTETITEEEDFNTSEVTEEFSVISYSGSNSESIAMSSKKSSEDGSGGGSGATGGVGVSESKSLPKSDEFKSIMAKYPGGKSKVETTGEESRVELMEKVLDMDDEIGELLSLIRKREDDYNRMCKEVKSLRHQIEEVRDESHRNEMDLMQELDMLHDKNTVMSNLLDIINERAEAAEEELEKRIQEGRTASPPRSASNVSQVSALSDISMGSDEVFQNSHVAREGVVNRDWEAKLKGRIESLERLLAEERQKVMMAEKKLAMADTETVAPSVTDDVKLRLREKELLQAELIESQRHLHIAADQIQGLKERFTILDEEHCRLKKDYGILFDEVEKPVDKTPEDPEDKSTEMVKTPVNPLDDDHPFASKRISVIEAPNYKDLKKGVDSEEMKQLRAQLEDYKKKTQDLEYKIEEINDIWRSKSSASDRDRDELERELHTTTQHVNQLNDTLHTLHKTLQTKNAIIAQHETILTEKSKELDRKCVQTRDVEKELKSLRETKHSLEIQISQKDGSVRGLNEKIRTRDERLKEKDDILIKLRSSFDEAKSHVKNYEKKFRELGVEVNDKDAVIACLKDQITKGNNQSEKEKEVTCSSDSEEAELNRLKDEIKKLKDEADKKEKEKADVEKSLGESRKILNDSMVMWHSEKSGLQRDLNVLEEKVRLYEVYNTQSQGEAVEALKEEAYSYFTQKEALNCELASSKIGADAMERTHRVQIARLQTDLNDKLKQLKMEVENNTRLRLEAERLGVQAEKAYRFQQEVRVLRAEHQAMKVRYESRLDKMANECNRMVTTIEKLKKQHQVDQDLIQKFEQNMTLVTERYTDQLLKADDDQNTMKRQMDEVEELRSHLEEVMAIVQELREKSLDQDRLRSDLVTRMATDKSKWEMERAGLVSQINQMDEHMSSSSQQSTRERDIQVNLGISWEKERKEQKRLLAEAHTLALDLQDQLRSRDETFAHEKKEILRKMEADRMSWMREKREMERRIAELESADRRLESIQQRLKETQDTLMAKSEQWRLNQKEWSSILNQSRKAHARDCKKIEEVLAGLVKFKELESVLALQSTGQREDVDKNVTTGTLLSETVEEISKMTEELSKYLASAQLEPVDPLPQTTATAPSLLLPHTVASTTTSKTPASGTVTTSTATKTTNTTTIPVASTSASSVPNKTQTRTQPTVTTAVFSSKSTTTVKTTTMKTSSKISEKIKTLSGKMATEETAKTTKPFDTGAASSSSNQDAPSLNTKQTKTTKATPSLVIPPPQTAPVVTMRPFDPTNTTTSRRHDRPPSYTSGTRSAQSSRSTTPEVNLHLDQKSLFSQHHSSTLPKHSQQNKHQYFQHQPTYSRASSTESSSSTSTHKARRPVTFMKSLSTEDNRYQENNNANSPHRLFSTASPQRYSNSASSTPTHPAPSSSFTTHHLSQSSLSSLPTALDSNLLSPEHNTASISSASSTTSSQHRKKFSPRTARKRFFEESQSPSSETTDEISSWHDSNKKQPIAPKPLPDAKEFRREAEVEHYLISGKQQLLKQQQKQNSSAILKMSASWDEQTHASNYPDQPSPFYEDDSTTSGIDCTTPESSTVLSSCSHLPSNSAQFSTIPEHEQSPNNNSHTTSTLPRTSGKSAKEKRKFFKKSESLDSPVSSSIAKAGVSAMPMAAPSGFTPSNFFAAVKGKLLKPMLRHQKSSETKLKEQEEYRPPSPLFIPTDVPDINFGSGGTTMLPVPVPQRSFDDGHKDAEKQPSRTTEDSRRSRQTQRPDHQEHSDSGSGRGKGRSKSMDERKRTDSGGATYVSDVWRFNETHL